MANIADRLSTNVPGLFYVDSSCIDCDICREAAPLFFRRDDELGASIVYRQPINDAERALCRSALDGCPTESIGSEEGGF